MGGNALGFPARTNGGSPEGPLEVSEVGCVGSEVGCVVPVEARVFLYELEDIALRGAEDFLQEDNVGVVLFEAFK